jgi:hypothetical protein
MSTFDRHYSTSTAARVRPRTRDRFPRRPYAACGDEVTPVMGPANRAPGVSIMGAAIPRAHLGVMGGPDSGPRVSVMGIADREGRLDMFGESDLRFVDSLFAYQRRNHD